MCSIDRIIGRFVYIHNTFKTTSHLKDQFMFDKETVNLNKYYFPHVRILCYALMYVCMTYICLYLIYFQKSYNFLEIEWSYLMPIYFTLSSCGWSFGHHLVVLIDARNFHVLVTNQGHFKGIFENKLP